MPFEKNVNNAIAATDLDDLHDIDAGSPTNGDSLAFNSVSGNCGHS